MSVGGDEGAGPGQPVLEEESPPLLGRWRNLYLLVIGELVVTVLALYVLTRWAS